MCLQWRGFQENPTGFLTPRNGPAPQPAAFGAEIWAQLRSAELNTVFLPCSMEDENPFSIQKFCRARSFVFSSTYLFQITIKNFALNNAEHQSNSDYAVVDIDEKQKKRMILIWKV